MSENVNVVVETDRLKRVLNGSRPDAADNVVPFALRPGASAAGLIHVEAGIKIDELNCVLDQRGLAMPTLGGEKGQSLAGVISTGTHGSDVADPPIADAVQAVHLVGPGGREWWIERGGNRAITDGSRMEQLRRAGHLCGDLMLEYDDQTFSAVLVSMGRMGIIYSVVLRAVPAFLLREAREPTQWSAVQGRLRATGPEAPIRGFHARWVEIVYSPFLNGSGDHDCVITRKTETSEDLKPRPPEDLAFGLLCGARDLGPAIGPMMFAVDAAALAAFGLLLAIPFLGPPAFTLATTGYATLRVSLELLLRATTTGADMGQALARVCTAAAAIGQSWIVRDLVGLMIGQIRGPLPEGYAVDKSFNILTSQSGCGQLGQPPPHCMRQIDGLEFAFDAGPGRFRYIDFVNAVGEVVEDLLRRDRPVGVALSLRFTGRSEALLAMQQFGTTCSIEVIVLRGLPGNEEVLRRVQELAYSHGGIPHWGLIHDVTRQHVAGFYDDRLSSWRRVLLRLIDVGGGRTETFSTRYSVQRDLEPLPSCTLPPALGRLVLQALEALARAYAKRRAPRPKPGSGMPPPKGGRGRRRAKARWERGIALLGAEPRANPTATASPDDPSSAGNSRP